jgi:Icc-related predicted phosphoesterase
LKKRDKDRKKNYKILAVSDIDILKKYSIVQLKEKFKNIDFILAAGDLSYEYLDYLVSVLDKDLIYVNGNHLYAKGHDISFCKNIDGKFIKYKGLYILGLDGSKVYSYKEHQYTEKQMKRKINKNYIKMLINKPDIVLSHAPPYDIHDVKDVVHEGFIVFRKLIKFAKPKLWVHGHIHLQNHLEIQETQLNKTKIVNAYGYKIIDIEL